MPISSLFVCGYFYFIQMKKKDWVGKKFDMLTILEELPDSKFLVKCDCGSVKEIKRSVTYAKYFKTCGCLKHKHRTGEKFGMLTIIEDFVDMNKYSMRYCIAECDCGRQIKTRTNCVVSGETTTCGCLRSKSLGMNIDAFKYPNEESLYWAGFIAADGNVSGKYLRISLQERDINQLNKFNKWLNADYKISLRESNRSYQIQVHSKSICFDLLDYGITERKCHTYTPPEFCIKSPDFWRGMIDGDGCLSQSRVPYRYPIVHFCGAKATCDGFRQFVSSFCESKANVRPAENIFNISYGGKYAIQIMKVLYGNNPKFYLDRKYELANKFCNFALADNSEII